MNKDKILAKAQFSKYGSYQLRVYSPMLKYEIDIAIDVQGNKEEEISEVALQTIQDFLNWDEKQLTEIQEGIWQNCLNCNHDERYSLDRGKTWLVATRADKLAEYNIKNKEDALQQAKIKGAFISNKWKVPGKILWLSCETSWDPEHGCTFIYKDNELKDIE